MIMRKLQNDDMFILSEIADKMNLEYPNIPPILTKKKTTKNEEEYNIAATNYGKELLSRVSKKMHLAPNEINKLLVSVTEKTIEDIKAMPIKESKSLFNQILLQDGVIDFFL
jgi:restriction endonuclease